MGRLIDFLATSRTGDRDWCCDRCRDAAQGSGRTTGNRHAAQQGDTYPDNESERRYGDADGIEPCG